MVRLGLFFSLVAALNLASVSNAQTPEYEGPVIDMHIHAYPADGNGPPGTPLCPNIAEFRYDGSVPWPQHLMTNILGRPCDQAIKGSLTDEALRDETIAEMRARNVRGLLGGPADRVNDWVAAAPDLFWPARHLNLSRDEGVSPDSLEAEFDAKQIVAISEITNQYAGIMADDPRMDAFWAMAERTSMPVGIHVGLGPPGTAKLYPEFRVQHPSHLEEVLNAYPDLRLFVMHAGYPFVAEMKALLYVHPQLMVETGVLQFALPEAEYNAFLKELVQAGFADRIMFGSDQMNWPGAIGLGIDAINRAPYLSTEQKRMILHDNAARFLRLGEAAWGRQSKQH